MRQKYSTPRDAPHESCDEPDAIESFRHQLRAGSTLGSAPTSRDPWQLRANAYRVLLTRARDLTVVFLPELRELDSAATYLVE